MKLVGAEGLLWALHSKKTLGTRVNTFFIHIPVPVSVPREERPKPGKQPSQVRGSPASPPHSPQTLPRSGLADPLPGRPPAARSKERQADNLLTADLADTEQDALAACRQARQSLGRSRGCRLPLGRAAGTSEGTTGRF